MSAQLGITGTGYDQPEHARQHRVVIVGGGISGLTAAYRLQELSVGSSTKLEVLLLEASARLGGIVHTEHRDGFLLEGGPDSFISEKPEAVALAERLGIAHRLINTNNQNRRSFVVRNERLQPVPEGFHLLAPSRFWPFVASNIFSWRGKARIGLELLVPPRRTIDSTEDETLAGFVRRRLGQEALERMAQPMVGGIYTADPEQLSLRATMPRFLEMERQHGSVIRALRKQGRKASKHVADSENGTSGARYSLFLSFDTGMQTLTDELTTELGLDVVRLNTRVDALSFDSSNKQWKLRTGGGETIKAGAICLALPAYEAARLLRDVDERISSELNAIPYASTATINLAYRRADIPHPLDGFGFVVPAIERLTTLACTFSSVKFSGRAPEGFALLRAFVGGALQPESFTLDEDRMVEAVQSDLRLLLGITAKPIFHRLEKWPRSMAQYHLGHLDRVTRIEQHLHAHPTLQLANNALGVGIPDCIRNGEQAAERLFAAVQAIP